MKRLILPESELKWNTAQEQIVSNELSFLKAHTNTDTREKESKPSLLTQSRAHS